MSRITKAICDECGKEIEYKDWYYTADIVCQSNASGNGEQILDGDYCEECFKKKILKRVVNKD